jgi:predicted nucleic acid-binding protein
MAACAAPSRRRIELRLMRFWPHTPASAGQMIGSYDVQIAAIALANNCALVTHNTTEFSRVPGLKLEDWQIP